MTVVITRGQVGGSANEIRVADLIAELENIQSSVECRIELEDFGRFISFTLQFDNQNIQRLGKFNVSQFPNSFFIDLVRKKVSNSG